MNQKEIIEHSWAKNWEGHFSILASTLAIEAYHKPMAKNFNTTVDGVFIIHKNGVSSCYLSESDMEQFGKNLASQATKQESLLKQWSDQLKKETDNVRTLMKKYSDGNINGDDFSLLQEAFDQFGSYQIATKEVINHLPKELLDKYDKHLMEARLYCEKVYPELAGFSDKLAEVLGEKENYDSTQIESLTNDELETYFAEGELPSKEELKERYKNSGLVQSKDKRRILSSEEVEEIESAWQENLKVDSVKGQTAFGGKVIGTCRIIRDFRKIENFQEGDILVTGMTDPDYVPLMKKAGAIVTDAGGLLCHAAIVSRELKTPCIIGTKIATQVLKDGMEVEVDADNGVIKILK